MALLSSPLNYPASSSPIAEPHGQKRKRFSAFAPLKRRSVGLEVTGTESSSIKPLADVAQQVKPKGPFEDDESDEDTAVLPASSRREDQFLLPSPSTHPPPPSILNLSHSIASPKTSITARTSGGLLLRLGRRKQREAVSFEKTIAARSENSDGKATKNFYGVGIHDLLDTIDNSKAKHIAAPVENQSSSTITIGAGTGSTAKCSRRANMLWTEKYRARKFTDLVGDDRVHRDVLRWIKTWDPIVFPGSLRSTKSKENRDGQDPSIHRKILMLTGSPGLGKTTLAHVCAKQAGYEVLEINASDDRTSSVVKERIQDCLGTETVKLAGTTRGGDKGVSGHRPTCVVVDEVDGAVTGSSSSGEGGFIKALLDLVTLDQKNTTAMQAVSGNVVKSRRKGNRFRQLRPLILICNDVYHPSLRPLRTSQMAEIIRVRPPPFDKVVTRLSSIFQKEGLACDQDAIRKLCESAWGSSNKKEHPFALGNAGDFRACLVLGQWIAAKLRGSPKAGMRLNKAWVDLHMDSDSANGGTHALGRGGTKEIVERVFLDNAGFPKEMGSGPTQAFVKPGIGVADIGKGIAMNRLRGLVDATGESDRILLDCFSSYASRPIQDDTFLSKPNAACEWLHFHDQISSRTHQNHDWELGSYLSQSILGFHDLLASNLRRGHVDKKWDAHEEPEGQFVGLRAHAAALEAQRQQSSLIHAIQASLSIPLARSFRSAESLATELVPQLVKMLTPDVRPTIIGGNGGGSGGVVSIRKESERRMVERSVKVMDAVGVSLERMRIEDTKSGQNNYIYRMEPALDDLNAFSTSIEASGISVPARFAVREAMAQEHEKFVLYKQAETRRARYEAGAELAPVNDRIDVTGASHGNSSSAVARTDLTKKDFFGRSISGRDSPPDDQIQPNSHPVKQNEDKKVWVTYHEGYSNAVRKPITLEELLKQFEKPI